MCVRLDKPAYVAYHIQNSASRRKNEMSEQFDPVLAYHQATKRHFHRFARGPGRLDWATQPDPFRRYRDALVIHLDQPHPSGTGIGCFFDDGVHELSGLGTMAYQSLYHFTVGFAVKIHA